MLKSDARPNFLELNIEAKISCEDMALLSEDQGESLPVQACRSCERTTELQEFICGWGAAFVNISLTFPINKVMFRQMLLGVDSQKAVSDLKKEGVHFLYRGILPPLLQKTASVSLMFGMFDQCQKFMQRAFPGASPLVSMSASAILAGSTEAVLTPFERVQTLLQDKHYNGRYRNSFHAFRELRTHGFKEYYRGLGPILMRNGPSNVLFFGLRGEVKKVFPKTRYAFGDVVADFFSGAVVGAFISTVFYPINVVKTRMQSRVGCEYAGVWATFREIYAERGYRLRGIFLGVHVNYTRALLSWGIINASYELLKKLPVWGSVT